MMEIIGPLFRNSQPRSVRRSDATDPESQSSDEDVSISHSRKRTAETKTVDSEQSNNNKKTKKQKTASFNETPSNSSHKSSGADRRRQKRGPYTSVGWEHRFEELKAFKSKHGDCLVPTTAKEPYKKLGKWVTDQRTAYSKYVKEKEAGKPSLFSSIMEKRIVRLEEIGFVWSVKKRSKRKVGK